MIRGRVDSNLCALLRLWVRGPSGTKLEIETLIDRGFDDSLILPMQIVSMLGLDLTSKGRAVLADGSTKDFDIYSAEVEWENAWRPVLVSAVGNAA